MTFRDLQKLVQSQSEANISHGNGVQKLLDKPFWIFDKEQLKQQDLRTKGHCCFWHVIGLPQKDGHDMPLLPYQRTLYDSLQNYKHIWIKKSRGIGVTDSLFCNDDNRGSTIDSIPVIPQMNFATTTNGTTANMTIPVCNSIVGGPCLDPNTHTIIP